MISQRLTAPKTTSGTLVLTQAYGYDNVNRITSAAESGAGTAWSQGYGFGPDSGRFGNLVVSGDQPAPTLACGTYSSSTNRCMDAYFGYDAAGNMNAFPGGQTATYDAENRQVTLTDGTTYTYSYDGEGRRVKKVGGGVTTVFVYDAFGKLAAEYDSSSSGTVMVPAFLTADHLGTTRLVTNSAGAVRSRYEYYPFGEQINTATQDTFNPKFTGKPRDYESGLNLDYFGARYFAGAQGRFTSVDPVYFQAAMVSDPQRFNLYAYVRNNPLRFVDPKGEEIELTGETDEERRRQLAAIQAAVGVKAGALLTSQFDKASGQYRVEVQGSMKDFKAINDTAAGFGSIIENSKVAKLDLVASGQTLPFSVNGKQTTLAEAGAVGGTSVDASGQLWVVVQTPRYGYPGIERSKFYPSGSGVLDWLQDKLLPSMSRDLGTITAHEFGHAQYCMENRGNLGSPASNEAALKLENSVRQARGEPSRVKH